MNTSLEVVVNNGLSEEIKNNIDTQIELLISRHKDNRYEINRLVFESVSALTANNNYSTELASQGKMKRFWGGITGKNRNLQNKIDSSLAAAQYASQQTLQKLAEQNLMSFELITAVNNKLNTSIVEIEDEINKIYGTLITFFKQTKSDIIQLENRVERLEKNVQLLNWLNSIEYQMWNGIEYSELDVTSKLVCLVRDFYDLTHGDWSTSDLLLLKSALGSVGVSPKEIISYKNFIDRIVFDDLLWEKLFGDMNLKGIEHFPMYLLLTSSIKKRKMLNDEESFIIESIQEILYENQCEVNSDYLADKLVNKYIINRTGADILRGSVECYDLMLEILYNYNQIKDLESNINLDEEEQKKLGIFSISDLCNADNMEIIDQSVTLIYRIFEEYNTVDLLPLLEQRIKSGDYISEYVLALLYEFGCEGLDEDDDKCKNLLDEAAEKNYFPAIVHRIMPMKYEYCLERRDELKDAFEKIAEKELNDPFFCFEYVRCLCDLEWIFDGERFNDFEEADKLMDKVPKVYRDYIMAKRFDYARGVEKDYKKSFQLYLEAADCGLNCAKYEVAYALEHGFGCERNTTSAKNYLEDGYKKGYKSLTKYLGMMEERDGNVNYITYYQKGAELGDDYCMFEVARYYWFKHDDAEKSKKWLKKASELGNSYAKDIIKNEIEYFDPNYEILLFKCHMPWPEQDQKFMKK